MRVFFVLIACFCIWNAADASQESASFVKILESQRVSVDYQQLEFTENGIFLRDDNGNLMQISALFYDDNGYYISVFKWQCCQCWGVTDEGLICQNRLCGHRKCRNCTSR